MSDLYAGTWQEVMYKRMRNALSQAKKIECLLDKLKDDVDAVYQLEELDDWFDAFQKEIHIPVWNKFPEITPDQLKIPVTGYIGCSEGSMDIAYQVDWDSKNKVFRCWNDENHTWEPDADIDFWIPITYPEIW